VHATGPGETADTGPAPALAPRARHLALSTFVFALATGLSRVLGLVREIVAAYYFGTAGKINAFTVAFQVPNLVRALVADSAVSSAFVPVFSGLLEKGDRKRAWQVASSVFWLLLLGLTGLTALLIVIAPLVIAPFGQPPGYEQLAITLSRILFPIVALLGISGVIVGILNSYDEFTIPALAPVAWNVVIILGLVIGVPHADGVDAKLYVYAGAILVGTIVQVLLPVPWLRGLDGQLRMAIDWRDPLVKQVFVLMIPVTVSLGLINFNALVDTLFASRLIDPRLAPAAIDKAFRLYMLPQGMFSVAVATVLFPSLSRAAARLDMDAFRRTLSTGLRQIGFLLVPASVLLAVLAVPTVRLLFQRGAFTPSQTTVVAGALAAFAAGLTFNGTMLMLNRAFFSLQANWIPTLVALGNLFLNAVLDALFYPVGVWGIPLSTSLVNVAGTAALLVLLRRRLGRIGFGEVASSYGRVIAASVATGAAAFAVWWLLDDVLGRSLPAQIASLTGAVTAAVATYFGACTLLRVRELGTLRALRARRGPDRPDGRP
jgi:putative peptidoglycan lipid II flippase